MQRKDKNIQRRKRNIANTTRNRKIAHIGIKRDRRSKGEIKNARTGIGKVAKRNMDKENKENKERGQNKKKSRIALKIKRIIIRKTYRKENVTYKR